MSELIPSMTFTAFKKLKIADLKNLKSVEITADGEYIFTAIIPHGDSTASDYVRVQAEYLGVKANITGGIDPDKEEDRAPVRV